MPDPSHAPATASPFGEGIGPPIAVRDGRPTELHDYRQDGALRLHGDTTASRAIRISRRIKPRRSLREISYIRGDVAQALHLYNAGALEKPTSTTDWGPTIGKLSYEESTLRYYGKIQHEVTHDSHRSTLHGR